MSSNTSMSAECDRCNGRGWAVDPETRRVAMCSCRVASQEDAAAAALLAEIDPRYRGCGRASWRGRWPGLLHARGRGAVPVLRSLYNGRRQPVRNREDDRGHAWNRAVGNGRHDACGVSRLSGPPAALERGLMERARGRRERRRRDDRARLPPRGASRAPRRRRRPRELGQVDPSARRRAPRRASLSPAAAAAEMAGGSISLARAREALGESASKYSDAELARMLEEMRELALLLRGMVRQTAAPAEGVAAIGRPVQGVNTTLPVASQRPARGDTR